MSEIDMKKIKIFPVFLLLFLFLSVWSPSALALDDPQVTAKAVLLADADSGRIFFSQNADMKMYPASLTKIMTVLLAVEAVDRGDVSLDDEVTCSEECLAGMDEDGSTANIVAGETMKLRDLMYCALVESANEACNVIAEYIGGSIGNFVQMMNDRAGELGCTGTHFANTHGLPDENHYTTAADMYLITMEAINQDLFMEICNTAKYTVSATNMT
ncbi:MAG: D-alanyl-D-alanine carboxypeptidase, partial [Clostridia bacterium]|nr:D-alanyl-D-alanine carboxypeptidase [Clostridia bacterium]